MEPRDLSAYVPYRAGRGVEEVARELGLDPEELVKLSSNENPLGPSPAAVEAIRESVESIGAYPKAVHTDLTVAIADRAGVEPEQVWLTPGGDGLLDYVGRALLAPGDGVLVPDPGFAYYEMSARYHGGEIDQYELDRSDGFEQTAAGVLEEYDGHRIVYVTTPHNPTGSEMPHGELEQLAAAVDPETLVLIDEAYIEFSDRPSARPLLDSFENVCLLRTFSKAYGLAGLRVGYGLVPAAWARAYERVNTPFAVNALGCRAGLAALEDDEHLERSIETARWAREYIHDQLAARTFESGGNFVLAEVGDGTHVADAARAEGVIVRDCGSFGLPDCIRVSCGTRETTPQAVETLNEVLDP